MPTQKYSPENFYIIVFQIFPLNDMVMILCQNVANINILSE